MEDSRNYGAQADVVALPQFVRPRHEPDVPEDVDFYMDHLNDPNFDLRGSRHSLRSARTDETFATFVNRKHKHEKHAMSEFGDKVSDFDSESQAHSSVYYPDHSQLGSVTDVDYDDESPYPEVRAAVSSIDDPTMPVSTFRMWLLGLFYVILTAGLNQLFSMRYPSVYLTGIVAQLTSLPLGRMLARILPTRRFRTFGYVWSLNPGPFNVKEHVVITVMANVAISGAYATDIIATQRVFYNQTLSMGYQLSLVLSTQLLGFSLGGILRRFVVWPASMIWPGALVNAALFNTLHKTYGNEGKKHMSREKFFCIALACSFVWYWVPGFLWTGLSVFNWVCWIAPNNVVVNQLFGTSTGLGMGLFTFDWAMISYIGSPLVSPWWSQANIACSLVLCFWIIAPILYYTNSFFAKFMPMSAYTSFDRTGLPYDPTQIVTDGTFDLNKYLAYSPLFISTTMTVAYGVAFAAFAALVVHTILWFRRDIMKRFSSSLRDEKDVHSRLMSAYPETPHWWFIAIGIVAFPLLLIAIHIFPTQLPIWAATIAFVLAAILSLPLAMIQAITNQNVGLQVMHEMIAGYMLPGKPIANMIFKCIGYIGSNQAVGFSGDLKLGHYMKIPPRMMFVSQVVAAIVTTVVVTLTQEWMFVNIPDFCTPAQTSGFICPSTNTFATASLIWGGIGPARLFSVGGMYHPILYFFLVGALAPFPFYFLARRYPLSLFRYINMPIFFAGLSAMPPASGINYSSWALTGFIFNFFIRRRHFRWWMRYNYILSAALDAGVALGLVVIFFTLQLPQGGAGVQLDWWGNTNWWKTADALGTPMYVLAPGETFGPNTWS